MNRVFNASRFVFLMFVSSAAVFVVQDVARGEVLSVDPIALPVQQAGWPNAGEDLTEVFDRVGFIRAGDASGLHGACDECSIQDGCGYCLQHSRSRRWTSRSFLFLWPGQNCSDLRIDLNAPLVTDRPDFTEASSTVGRGVTQFELGYSFFSDDANGVRTRSHSFPETLIRQGVLCDWLELRFAYNAASISDQTSTLSGSEDLYIGAKLGLTPQCGWLPEMSVIPQATLDTGSDGLTNGKNLFGANLIYSWALNDALSLAGSTQFNQAIDGVSGNEYTQWAQSIASGASITDDLGCYMEWYAFFPDNADTDGVEHYINGGFTY